MASVLNGVSGPFDVPTQIFVLDSFNPGSNINIPNLSFSPTTVMGAFVKYVVSRTTSTDSGYEIGTLNLVFNPNGPSGNKWEVGRIYNGDAEITFTVTDTGQIQISTLTLAGINHVGQIAYAGTAFLKNQ